MWYTLDMVNNESTPRIMWGEKVGEGCYCKTPAQAVVARLWYISVNLKNAKSEKEVNEYRKRASDFLSTFESQLLPDENADEILVEALEYSRRKEESSSRLVMPENIREKTSDIPVVITTGDYPSIYKTISEMITLTLQNRNVAECEGM